MLASELTRSVKLDEFLREQGVPCLSAYAQMLERTPGANLSSFLHDNRVEDHTQLAALIAMDMRHRIAADQPCRVEQYLERFPKLRGDREQVLDLVYAEYCARTQHGTVVMDEYYRRFPAYQQSLARLFSVHSLLGHDPAVLNWRAGDVASLPDAGDEFLDFRLLRELGRGAFGRVFLAHQTSLSDRLVVVKITARQNAEPQTLARLKHPSIVPIHSVHRDELTGLQVVCMPYQNAVALSDVERLWTRVGRVPYEASALLDAVNELVPSGLRLHESEIKRSLFPRRASFVHGCCWLMHRLAQALEHAHAQGIFHRDLKPSNILITPTGEPLLVDFNLAFDPIAAEGSAQACFGGTLPYMPPEQLEALGQAQPVKPDDVGPRADLYALAATFFELLTGQFPFAPQQVHGDRQAVWQAQRDARWAGVPSARRLNRHVPTDVDRLVAKCLEPSLEQRYESAEQVAEDLSRFLEDRPLRHVGKIPSKQVALKWMRRNRRGLGFALAGALIVWSLGLMYYHQRRVVVERDAIEATLKKAEAEGQLLTEPRSAEEAYGKAYMFLREKRYQKAEQLFTKALEMGYWDRASIFYFRGKSLAAQDKDLEARDDYSSAIESNPKYVYAYLGRAMTSASSSKHPDCEEALSDVERALSLGSVDLMIPIENLYFEAARIYACAARTDASLLDKAAEFAIKAIQVNNGLEEQVRTDRLLGPILERPDVRKAFAQSRE